MSLLWGMLCFGEKVVSGGVPVVNKVRRGGGGVFLCNSGVLSMQGFGPLCGTSLVCFVFLPLGPAVSCTVIIVVITVPMSDFVAGS